MPHRLRRLLLVGGGGFARELLWIARLVPLAQRDWEPAGYLDDNVDEAAARSVQVDVPFLGTIRDHRPASDELFIPAVGNPAAKLALCEQLAARGGEFATVLHPLATVGPGSSVGRGVVLAQFATVSVDASIGDFVMMNFASTVGHDAVVGDGCTISSFCDVTGRSHLGRGVFLGSHASVHPGVHVGAFATVGAGSAAMRRVPEGATVIGVPAKRFL